MRPPCVSINAAAMLRCHAMLSAGDWRSSVLTRAYNAASKVVLMRSASLAPSWRAETSARWIIASSRTAAAVSRAGGWSGTSTWTDPATRAAATWGPGCVPGVFACSRAINPSLSRSAASDPSEVIAGDRPRSGSRDHSRNRSRALTATFAGRAGEQIGLGAAAESLPGSLPEVENLSIENHASRELTVMLEVVPN